MQLMNASLRARRLLDRPVIEPGSVPGYEPIFNAGLMYRDGVYHVFARAIRAGYRRNPDVGPRFLDYVSDVLVFESEDGLAYRFRYVIAQADEGGVRSFEDPRVQTVLSDDHPRCVMTYTNFREGDGAEPWRIGAHDLSHEDGRFWLDETSARIVGPEGIANKDAVIFNLADGKVALLHRIAPNVQIAIFDSIDQMSCTNAEYWSNHVAEIDRHTLITPSPGALAVGAGAPPIVTDAGLVLFFHEHRGDGAYTMNAALLDAAGGRVLARLDRPILEPELAWEREGDVQNVVFVQGAHRREDGTIYLTYGAADRSVGAALISEGELLEALASATS